MRGRKSGHCLQGSASDAIAGKLLTGLLCWELPEATAPYEPQWGLVRGIRVVTPCAYVRNGSAVVCTKMAFSIMTLLVA